MKNQAEFVKDTMQLIRMLHPHDSVWRTTVGLKAFFDDSGTHDGSKVLALAGCIAREEQWLYFAQAWQAMLDEYEIQVFHMSELESLKGEFSGWTEERKRKLIGSVIGIARKWAKNSIASVVLVDEYAQVIPDWAKKSAAFGDDYNFCFQMCIGQAMGWVDALNPPMPARDQVAFVFDQQEKLEGVTRNTFTQIKKFRDVGDRMGTLAFASKKRFLPLQLADFFAYESYKFLDNMVNQSARMKRAPLRILTTHGYEFTAHCFTRSDLEVLVSKYENLGRPAKGNEPWWPWKKSPLPEIE
jgi:hypothetical protein